MRAHNASARDFRSLYMTRHVRARAGASEAIIGNGRDLEDSIARASFR